MSRQKFRSAFSSPPPVRQFGQKAPVNGITRVHLLRADMARFVDWSVRSFDCSCVLRFRVCRVVSVLFWSRKYICITHFCFCFCFFFFCFYHFTHIHTHAHSMQHYTAAVALERAWRTWCAALASAPHLDAVRLDRGGGNDGLLMDDDDDEYGRGND
jgi:hypothetical protein